MAKANILKTISNPFKAPPVSAKLKRSPSFLHTAAQNLSQAERSVLVTVSY